MPKLPHHRHELPQEYFDLEFTVKGGDEIGVVSTAMFVLAGLMTGQKVDPEFIKLLRECVPTKVTMDIANRVSDAMQQVNEVAAPYRDK